MRSTIFEKQFFFLAVAAVIAIATFSIIQWSNVGTILLQKKQMISADPSSKGNPIKVSISCRCPPVLIESRRQNLVFEISLKSNKNSPLCHLGLRLYYLEHDWSGARIGLRALSTADNDVSDWSAWDYTKRSGV